MTNLKILHMSDFIQTEFERLFQPIEDFIANTSNIAENRAKLAAKVIKLAAEISPYIEKDGNKVAKKIIKNYGTRETREAEKRRQNDFLQGFDAANSRAKDLTKMFHGGKDPPDEHLKSLFKMLEADGKFEKKIPREATRSKNAILKFIEDNYDIFKQSYDEGYRLESGNPESETEE